MPDATADLAVYLRVSTVHQDVAAQRGAVESWLHGHGVMPRDNRWYVDNAMTGANTRRPEFQRLTADVESRRIGTIVVYALDRIARNALEGMLLLHDWLNRGVRVVAVTQDLDFGGPLGRLVANLLLHMAEWERQTMLGRQAAGHKAARALVARVHELTAVGQSPATIAAHLGKSREVIE